MQNKTIIIVLVLIIAVLAAMIGIAVLHPFDSKESTKINITSDDEQYEGGEVSVNLTDMNGTPISGEILNITISDSDGKIVLYEAVETDSEGGAELDLDLEKGNYSVNVTYRGNENYTGNSTIQKLIIMEEVVEAQSSSSDESSDDEYVYSKQNQRYYKASGEWEKDDKGNDVYTYQGDDGVLYQRYYDSEGNEISGSDYFR